MPAPMPISCKVVMFSLYTIIPIKTAMMAHATAKINPPLANPAPLRSAIQPENICDNVPRNCANPSQPIPVQGPFFGKNIGYDFKKY